MPRAKAKGGSGSSRTKLLTLSEVSKRTGISMPTLQRYKKLYQRRIPSEGVGRKQRYPLASLPIFEELKKENLGRRGRPRKNVTAAPRATAKAAASGTKRGTGAGGRSTGLLTLMQIRNKTGISYPTLVRYVKLFSKRIPSEGEGRLRRFLPDAVEVFQQLRGESRRGGRRKGAGRPAGSTMSELRAAGRQAGAALSREAQGRIRDLEKTVSSLQKTVTRLVKKLTKPRKLI